MVAWLPIRGSIYELAARFVDPALGFAMGWTYFFAGAMLVCTEYSAVATVMGYWNVDVNPAVWIAMAIFVCYFLNMVAVKWYGETGFIMGSTKILLLLGLMMATFITMVGGNPRHDAYGFRNWSNGDFMHAYYAEGSTGIFLSICISVRHAVFTIGGPDIISFAAGEIRDPRRTIPRVAKLVINRILFFYVFGVSWVCVTAVTLISLMSFLVASNESSKVFSWFLHLTTVSLVVNFTAISWVFICWRRALRLQGIQPTRTKKGWLASVLRQKSSNLESSVREAPTIAFPYVAPFTAWTPYVCLVLGSVISLFIGFDVFVPWSTQGFVTSYFGLAWFVGMFAFWKVFKRTSFVDPVAVDIYAGGIKQAIDDECRIWDEGLEDERREEELRKKNVFMRALGKFWGA
ncbi:proline transporter [Colletotrichum sojae]|uniref:Proline transporter n=1 Tax=Colletotrichum sojae TaxID=2175907 RepID=A0A8H6JLL8_9PEZI|nr:proline transporter [Colletotrichum sojae]